jgi:hypothetical protein
VRVPSLAPLSPQQERQVVARLEVLWLDRDGAPQERLGGFRVAASRQYCAERAQRRGVIWLEGDGAAERFLGGQTRAQCQSRLSCYPLPARRHDA